MNQLRCTLGTSILGIYTDETHLRPKDCARLLGVSIATFWRLVSRGLLPTTKLTERTTTVKLTALRAFIASREEV